MKGEYGFKETNKIFYQKRTTNYLKKSRWIKSNELLILMKILMCFIEKIKFLGNSVYSSFFIWTQRQQIVNYLQEYMSDMILTKHCQKTFILKPIQTFKNTSGNNCHF